MSREEENFIGIRYQATSSEEIFFNPILFHAVHVHLANGVNVRKA
jgi:hypothetical protein